jgi:hypothetical protein
MTLLLLHAAATLFMTGLVWFVQVVHYPLFHLVGSVGFPRYEAQHSRRTSPVVAPVMLFELGSGLWLALQPPPAAPVTWLWLNAALLGVIWVSTFALQVPEHRALEQGFSPGRVDRLVATNWVRTAGWSLRALLLIGLLLTTLTPVTTPGALVPVPEATSDTAPVVTGEAFR